MPFGIAGLMEAGNIHSTMLKLCMLRTRTVSFSFATTHGFLAVFLVRQLTYLVCEDHHRCPLWVGDPEAGVILCQMLHWWVKNSPHFDSICDCSMYTVPLYSVYQAPLYQPRFTLLAWILPKLVNPGMLFILEMASSLG